MWSRIIIIIFRDEQPTHPNECSRTTDFPVIVAHTIHNNIRTTVDRTQSTHIPTELAPTAILLYRSHILPSQLICFIDPFHDKKIKKSTSEYVLCLFIYYLPYSALLSYIKKDMTTNSCFNLKLLRIETSKLSLNNFSSVAAITSVIHKEKYSAQQYILFNEIMI